MLTSSNISSSATKFSDFKQIVGKREFLWANHYTKIFCFCVHSGAPDLIYPETSLYEHILWMHLEKNRTYACTFPVQRKEINVVKVRFTMRYSSRKLRNDKVITTACNFWRQIACYFQVYGRTNHFCAKTTRKNSVLNFPLFFHLTNIDVTSCFCRQFFRPLYEDKGQKETIFNCKYLGDPCFDWAETS